MLQTQSMGISLRALDACKPLLVKVHGRRARSNPACAQACLYNMGASLRHAAMLLQAEKIKKAFGVASQRAAHEASSAAPVPPAVVPTSQHETMSDLLQRVLEL